MRFYKQLLIYLGDHGAPLVRKIFANASSFIKKPATLSTLVTEIDKLDWYSAQHEGLEARYQAARAQVEQLTPAPLAKAFRNELVPQDPADEPANVLLEHIRAARATV